MARLFVKKGSLAGLLLELDKDIIILGRDMTCDYFFEDNKMSRRHCSISKNGNEYYIIDNGSRNHVYLNGTKVSEASLHDGDVIKIGDTELGFELTSDEKHKTRIKKEALENSTWGYKRSIIDVRDDSYFDLPKKVTVQNLKEAYYRMVRLTKIGSKLQNASTWYELFNRAAIILLDEFSPDSVSIFRILSNEEFTIFVQKEQADTKAATKKVSRKILQDCYKRKMGFVVSDATKDPVYSSEKTIIKRAVRSAMCVPVILDDKVEAIIYLDSLSHKRKFYRIDLQLLSGITSQLVIHMRSIMLVQSSISERILQSELEVARKIQTRFIPDHSPEIQGVSVATYSNPAKTVGGDYYDILLLPDDKVAIIMADVSGKGLPAALMMASFRAHLLTEMNHTLDIEQVMHNMNQYVWEDVGGRIYVTAVLILYDVKSGSLEYVNAGHPYPLVFRKNGTVEEYTTGGFYLGLQQDNNYEKGYDKLRKGDTLVLYTDGFTDQMSEKKGIYGQDGLMKTLGKIMDQEPGMIVDKLVKEINAFLEDEDIFDDMSLIIFRLKKNTREK